MDWRTLKSRVRRARQWPPIGRVRFGSLGRTRPIDADYGFNRGTPVDRYYIDLFLAARAGDVRGRVLEVGDHAYTRRFGGDRVTHSDVLNVEAGAPGTTVVADLADAPHISDASYDCVICVQTVAYVWDIRAAIATLRRILKPGGVLLLTTAGIAKIGRPESDAWGDYWRLTSDSARRLFADHPDGRDGDVPRERDAREDGVRGGASGERATAGLGFADVTVTTYGNVLAATAMLQGISAEEVGAARLDDRDPDYEVTIAVRAVAPAG